MSKIMPIETRYQGNLFRSRLEARWAVLFDAMGIRWEYEQEGYKNDDILYLPDFWLPDYNMYAEVKGVYSYGEIPREQLIKILSVISPDITGIIMLGNIPRPGHIIDWAIMYMDRKARICRGFTLSLDMEPVVDHVDDYFPDEIEQYMSGEMSIYDDDIRLTGSSQTCDFSGEVLPPNKEWNAICAARQARFEHDKASNIIWG